MAGSMARHPIRVGLLVLLLAVAIAILLIIQLTSGSGEEKTISQTGGSTETVQTGGDIQDTESNPATGQTAGEPAAAATTTGATALLISTVGPTPNPTPPAPTPGPEPVTPGSISGHVDGEGARPVEGIYAYLADSGNNLTGAFQVTDAQGRFSFTGLTPGDYKVYFSDQTGFYDSCWYGPAGSPAGTAILVNAAQETTLVQSLEPSNNPLYGNITGQVTVDCPPGQFCPAALLGVKDVLVSAFQVDNNLGISLTLKGTAVTDSNGYYRMGNLPPGDYMVSFSPPGNRFAYQWYRGKNSYQSADIIPLLPGETVGKVDAALAAGGTISGTVTGESQPLFLARVDIFDSAGVIVDSTLTDSSGGYSSSRLPAGDYRVRVRPLTTDFEGEWYQDKPDFASANVVGVTDGDTSSDIDLDLARAPKAIVTPEPDRAADPPGEDTRSQPGDVEDQDGDGVIEQPADKSPDTDETDEASNDDESEQPGGSGEDGPAGGQAEDAGSAGDDQE